VLAFASQTDISNSKLDIRELKKQSRYPISNIQSPRDLGDIFISIPEARREAKKYGWTFKYELGRLVAHGALHLLGYDHTNEKDTRKMENIEREVLQAL